MKTVQLLLTVLVLLSTSARAKLSAQKKTTKSEKGFNATTSQMVGEQVASKDSPPKMVKKTKSAKTKDKQKYTKSTPTLMPTAKPTIKPTREPTIANSKPAPPTANCDPATDPECDDPLA